MPPRRTLRISHRSRSSLSCIRSPAFQLVDQFRIFKVSNQLLKTTCMRQTEYERQAKTLTFGPLCASEIFPARPGPTQFYHAVSELTQDLKQVERPAADPGKMADARFLESAISGSPKIFCHDKARQSTTK